MSWEALSRLDATCRPISGVRPVLEGRRALFSAPIQNTIKLVAAELRRLDATRIVLELDVPENKIRIDGMPHANAVANSPAVVLSFQTEHGPLRYATGTFGTWQDNLRAIALSLEALRAVDRYGVSKRGEQYQGWKAIPMSTDPADAIQTREQALQVIGKWAGLRETERVDESAIRAAIRATHPDTNPDVDPAEFRKVMRAKELLA